MDSYVPLIIAVTLVLWVLGQSRIRVAAQPLRLKLAESGELLLADPALPSHLRPYVNHMLNTAFDRRIDLLVGIFGLPFFVLVMFARPHSLTAMAAEFKIENPQTSERFHYVFRLHDRITFSNNPILSFIYEFEILLFVPALLLMFALVRGWMPEKATSSAVKVGLEIRELVWRRKLHLPQAA